MKRGGTHDTRQDTGAMAFWAGMSRAEHGVHLAGATVRVACQDRAFPKGHPVDTSLPPHAPAPRSPRAPCTPTSNFFARGTRVELTHAGGIGACPNTAGFRAVRFLAPSTTLRLAAVAVPRSAALATSAAPRNSDNRASFLAKRVSGLTPLATMHPVATMPTLPLKEVQRPHLCGVTAHLLT